jgi:hypothetical protein
MHFLTLPLSNVLKSANCTPSVSIEVRVDNDNHFVSFFAKKWLQTMIVLREKMMRLSRLSLFREKLNFSDNRDYREAIITISRFSPMSPLQSSVHSMGLYPLYGPLSPLLC